MRIAMRIAFRGGPVLCAWPGLRRGWEGEGEAPEGGVPRWYRAPAFVSSFLFLPAARPTDSRPRTRPRRAGGRRILGDPVSRPRGMEQAGLRAAAPGPGRPGRRRGSGRLEAHVATRLAFR